MNTTWLLTIVFICIGISLSLSGFAFYQTYKLKKLRKILLANGTPETIEEALNRLFSLQSSLEASHSQMQVELDVTQKILRTAIQKVGLVKFNSLENDGGNFSFSLALLNFSNTGILLTNLYGRTYNRIYVKHVTNGQSEIPLTEEETKALKAASVNQKTNYNEQQY